MGRVEDFAAADGSAPNPHIVGIFELGEICEEAVRVEVVHFLLAAECLVAGEGDDFHFGTHLEEGHIEAYLVVACPSGSVCNGVGSDFPGIFGYSHTLENPLG